MKKLLILIITLLLLTPTFSFASTTAKKKKVAYVSITYETKDSFVIKSKLFYPLFPKKVYPVVIMLHSIGYSSEYWGNLAKDFTNNGIAVLQIDLRGHGQSIYDSNFRIRSWQYYTEKNYAKYPDDITEILKYLAMNYPNISTTKYAILGADIGANTAILTAEKMPNKPSCLVLISPTRDYKGLYTPVAMTNLGTMPILSLVSVRDNYSMQEIEVLKKFAQSTFEIKKYPAGGMGMLMLKVNSTMPTDIVNWITKYLKDETSPTNIVIDK